MGRGTRKATRACERAFQNGLNRAAATPFAIRRVRAVRPLVVDVDEVMVRKARFRWRSLPG